MPVTPQEIYKKFLLKVNKNDTSTNIKIPEGVFVMLFNEQKRKFLNARLADDESSDDIDKYEELLRLDYPLTLVTTYKNRVDFALPGNFLKRASAYCSCSKGKCKDAPVVVWFNKVKDINVLLNNTNTNPSFDYQETIGIVSNGNVTIYKTDFDINKAYLSYYIEPKDIDIAGYTCLDGKPSTNIITELEIGNIELIIDRTVVEVTENYEDVERLQMALNRQKMNESKK